jgi:phospholipid/cholesterol/gamma-HCH transport system substrate-binding protein
MESNRYFEALIGTLTLLSCAFFLWFAFTQTAGQMGTKFYQLSALFPSVAGLENEAPVQMAGVRIGKVTHIQLDPANFMAKITFKVCDSVKIPTDSTAAITSRSLLGGKIVTLTPGIAEQNLAAGGVLTETQGPMDLEKMVSHLVFGDKKETKKD